MASTRRNTATVVNRHVEEVIIGFDEDARSIMDKLVEDRKQLGILSIVGMGGQGKTTLATKIFNDRYVVHHFHVRGWVTISQSYTKRDLLKGVLESIGKSVHEATTEPTLRELLYKSLKGRRYLVVIDDIWSAEAWKDLRRCLPDDNTSSRILLTTRLSEVASGTSLVGFTHNLRCLTEEESWELLCRKTFRGYECPKTLVETGKDIARKCQGLPLALVVIAGILKGEKNKEQWQKVAEGVNSYLINGPNGCLDTLSLSYEHLPRHLKNCFLYVGGFPEDSNIQVKKLIRLWMAEGFIIDEVQASLERTAEDYLMDLVERNLLIVAERRSDGRIKSCRLHDLLRELCLKTATDEKFFKRISQQRINKPPRRWDLQEPVWFLFGGLQVTAFNRWNQRREPLLLSDLDVSRKKQPRTRGANAEDESSTGNAIKKASRLFTNYEVLCEIGSQRSGTNVRSVLCIYKTGFSSMSRVNKFRGDSFLHLRVLDIQNHKVVDLNEIKKLIHLWYLAVWAEDSDISLVVSDLLSLQTLLVKGNPLDPWRLPYEMEKLVNLRHLCSERLILVDSASPILFNLQSISRLKLDGVDLLRSFPNIKKLACSVSNHLGGSESPNFAVLTYLESLNVGTNMVYGLRLEPPIRFPETLKRLTLKGLRLPWSCMSTIQQLPNLEVLKLLGSSFKGRVWNMGDEQFCQLRFLKLHKLDIGLWEMSSYNVPRLRKLVIERCYNLRKLSPEIGYISTLENIEIDGSLRLRESIEDILEEQHALGNDDIHLKVFYDL